MRKSDFYISKKSKAQISCTVTAQRLCFRYIDSTLPLLPKSKISSHNPSSVAVQHGLSRTRLETPKTDFVMPRLF